MAREAGIADADVRSDGPLTVAAPRSGGVAPRDYVCVLHGWAELTTDPAPAPAPAAAAASDRGPVPLGHALMAAWRRGGACALGDLRGDFALALWDRDSGTGALARDQLGSGALYVHCAGRRITFGSEVRAVLALLPVRPVPDEVALAHWLAVSGPPGDRTLYTSVRRLRPGWMIELGRDGWRERRYWTPVYFPPGPLDRDSAVAALREHLDVAVRRNVEWSQRPGVMLSGGLDSGSVAGLVAAAAHRGSSRPTAYSAVFPGRPRADESALIDRVTGTLALDSVRIAVAGGSPLTGSLAYLTAWQLPSSSPNLFFWLPLLRRAAADGVRVMLDGEGGDELFGTAHYLLADRIRAGRPLTAWRLARSFPGAGDKPPLRPVLGALRDYGLRGPDGTGSGRRQVAPPWLSRDLSAAYEQSDPPDGARRAGPRWWTYLQQSLTSTNGAVLARDQVRHRAAMSGLQARHPLLDLDVVTYVLGLDPEAAFDRHFSRPLLRASVHGLIPEEIRLRRGKSGFDSVFHDGLLNSDLPALRALLGHPGAETAAYVDCAMVRRRLLDHPGPAFSMGQRAWALYAWRLATAECWLRAQSDEEAPLRALHGLHAVRHEFQTRRHAA